MKIAIDAREAVGAIAGKGRYIQELVKALPKLDPKSQFFLYSKQPLGLDLPDNCENIIIGGLPGLRQLWLALDAKRRGADVMFAPTGYLPVVFSLTPTVVTIHDLGVYQKESRPTMRTYLAETLLMGLASRKSKKIVSVSESTKNDLMDRFRVNSDKIDVTLLGYDHDLYQPKSQDDQKILDTYKLKPGYLLFLGTLEPRKNIVGIIKAFANLPAELRQKHPLVIGGKKGWFYEEIFQTVTDLKLEKEVQFLGRVPDEHLPALYRQAQVFVFPSFYEGFGLPPLEAMACGTPAISSNISSLPEVVGKGGLLIDPHQPAEITKAMNKLLTDEAFYQQCKEEALKQVVKFDWQTTAKQTLAAFKEIAN